MAPGKWLPRPSRAKSVVAKYPDLFIICLSTSVQNLVLLSQNAQRVSYAAPLGVLRIKSCFAECTAADNYKNVPRNAMCRSKSCPLLHNSVGTSCTKPFSANPSHCSISSFFFSERTTWFPRLSLLLLTCLLLLFSFSVLQFLVVVSVRQIKPIHVGFRAHVKIASRIVSYRTTNPEQLEVMELEALECRRCNPQTRPSKSFVYRSIDLPWRHFQV